MLPASYHTGFAPRDGYPRFPQVWRGCTGAFAACLGPTGATLRDWSGRQNHGTLTNMTLSTAWGVNGNRYGILFDGSNDFVSITTTPSVRFFASDFSISFWYSASTNVGGYRLMWETQGYRAMTGGLAIYQNNAQLEIWKHTSGVGFTNMINFAGGVGLNVWRHLALIRQAGTLALYTDGVLRGTFADSQDYDAGNTTNLLNFGGGRTTFFFNGFMDDLLTHDRAINLAELRLLTSRRGIAYDMQQPYYYARQITSARRRKILTGQV